MFQNNRLSPSLVPCSHYPLFYRAGIPGKLYLNNPKPRLTFFFLPTSWTEFAWHGLICMFPNHGLLFCGWCVVMHLCFIAGDYAFDQIFSSLGVTREEVECGSHSLLRVVLGQLMRHPASINLILILSSS